MWFSWPNLKSTILPVILGLPAASMAAFQYFNLMNPPTRISQTGLYTDINTKVLDTAAKAYEVNSALWADDAAMKRWIILRPGKQIPWVDSTDLFDYPDSTVFVKNFYQVSGIAQADTVIWETRFLLFKKTNEENTRNWWGYSYRWNAAQNEARLVDSSLGFDTVFTYVDFTGKSTYKKWKFPSRGACNECHIGRTGELNDAEKLGIGRGILGFMPMQLKRSILPSGGTSADQVLRLFDQGVFSGGRPDAAALSKRFIGIKEPINPTVTAFERQTILENKARSYLAVNCSGCHGNRGVSVVATARIPPNFDFFDLKQHDLPWDSVSSGSLTDTTSYTDSLLPNFGFAKLKWLVQVSGLSAYPYWNMAIPAGDPSERSSAVFYTENGIGYPAFSNALFKQIARKMPEADSAQWYQHLMPASLAGETKATAILRWMFKAPWGSKAWLDTLKNHRFTLDSVMAGYYSDYMLYNKDPDQMPPLTTYLPDTSAMKIFAEWLNTGVITTAIHSALSKKQSAHRNPVIQNRILILPEGWAGKVQMFDMRGRSTNLQAAGSNRYALPAHLKPGLLLFKIGNQRFKAYLF